MSAASCNESDVDKVLHGNAKLGVVDFRVTESADQLEIVGVDADGQSIARVKLVLGHVEVPDIDVAGQGRTLSVDVSGVEHVHSSVGRAPLSLPPLESSAHDELLLDPYVAEVLARWDVAISVDEGIAEPFAANETGYGTGACTYSTCGMSSTYSCCQEDPKTIDGYPNMRRQYVSCTNQTRTIRVCGQPNQMTGCGLAGSQGCLACWGPNSYVLSPSWGTSYASSTDTCSWNAIDPPVVGGVVDDYTQQSGSGHQGEYIEIYGTNFSPSGNTVYISGHWCPISSQSTTQVNCMVNAGTPKGSQNVSLRSASNYVAANFPITISGVTIAAVHNEYTGLDGSATRNQYISIWGDFFDPSSNTVTIANVPCTVTYNSEDQINCLVSSSTPTGTNKSVRVTRPSGAYSIKNVTVYAN